MNYDHRALIVSPQAEPLTLEQVKTDRGGISHAQHDDMLTGLITAAREAAEKRTDRALLPQTWRELYVSAPCEIDLSIWPAREVVAVTIDGEAQDVAQLIADEDLEFRAGDRAMVISHLFRGKRVVIDYSAGYNDSAAVPYSIKQWMLLQIGSMYEHRESEIAGTITTKLKYVDGLLNQWKVR